MIATRHAVLITSTRASASSAAQRNPSWFIAASSSGDTRFMRMREEWNVERSAKCCSRARSIAGISVSIVVLDDGTIWPMRTMRLGRLSAAGAMRLESGRRLVRDADAVAHAHHLPQEDVGDVLHAGRAVHQAVQVEVGMESDLVGETREPPLNRPHDGIGGAHVVDDEDVTVGLAHAVQLAQQA